jgi:hypothetical protein
MKGRRKGTYFRIAGRREQTTMANGRISLTGRRAAANANNPPNLNRRRGAAAPHNGIHQRTGYSLFTRHSFFVLGVGILLGFFLLPLMMIEIPMDQVMDKLPSANSDFLMYTGRMNVKGADSTTTTPADKNKNPYLRPVDSDIMSKPTRNLDVMSKEGVKGISEVEQRIIEQHDFLSRQSVPTYTTPFIMKTAKLPDHQRMKILITGGAGFVGSHLVDKLMMEGQEVIVVDNFFTGQKKNIAHWLHHPNFRYEYRYDTIVCFGFRYICFHFRIPLSHTFTLPFLVYLVTTV